MPNHMQDRPDYMDCPADPSGARHKDNVGKPKSQAFLERAGQIAQETGVAFEDVLLFLDLTDPDSGLDANVIRDRWAKSRGVVSLSAVKELRALRAANENALNRAADLRGELWTIIGAFWPHEAQLSIRGGFPVESHQKAFEAATKGAGIRLDPVLVRGTKQDAARAAAATVSADRLVITFHTA